MTLPGLLIEYLITGATAFLWLWFLFHHPQIDVPTDLRLNKIDAATITLMAPLAYVLGMIIDFVSLLVTEALHSLLNPLRRTISDAFPEGWQRLKREIEPRKRSKALLSQQEVLLASPELGKQLEMRSSRDRVARGAFLNTLLGAAVVSSYYKAVPQTQVSSTSILLGGLVLAFLFFAMWLRLDHLTHKYRVKAGKAIRKKRATANLPPMELPLATPNIITFDYVFPVFIGSEVMKPTVVEGTAFGIGDGRFVTAAHCLREGIKSGWMALGTTDGKQLTAWNISAWELVDEYDLAVFHADVSVPVKCFPWHSGQLPMATTVNAAGSPYAIEPGRDRMGIRSFVGNVVSATTFGQRASDPPSYELSFQCPRGLSGSPLLIRHGDSMLIAGIVIGNQRTEMLVFSERELVSDVKEVITERYEALQLGIALQSRAFLDLGPFHVLNGRTIRQHLAEQALLSNLAGGPRRSLTGRNSR